MENCPPGYRTLIINEEYESRMKRWLLHIWMMGVLGMLAASCSQEVDGLEEAAEKQKVMLRFTIALDESKTASRSWNGYDDEDGQGVDEILGSIDENKINNVHALLYDLNGILIGTLNTTTPQVVESSNKHVYTVIGSIEVDADKVTDLDFKLMVFANCDLPTNLNNISTHLFTGPNTTNGNGIPMWGIATYRNIDLSQSLTVNDAYDLTGASTNGNNADEQAPVYMLRSMAKIEIALSEDMFNNYNLVGVTPDKYATQGYVMPTLQSTSGSETTSYTIVTLGATTSLGVEDVFNPYGTAIVNPATNGLAFHDPYAADANNAKRTWVVYVPEYNSSVSGALSFQLNLQDKSGKPILKTGETPYAFTHGYYNGGKLDGNSAWNVIRNHYYKYEITGINQGNQLALTCQVSPWNLQQQVVNYKDVPGTTAGGMISFGNDSEERKNNNDEVVGYDVKLNTTKLSTTCTFTLNSPLGYRWIASLVPMGEGNSAANCPFTFVMNGANVGLETSDIINGQEVTLTIATTATEGVEDNKEALLQIIVIKGDGTSVVLPKDIIGGPYYIMQTK